MEKNFGVFLKELDELIRKGDARAARLKMIPLSAAQVPREFKAELARLARRIRMSHLALKLLNPLVRPTGRIVVEATDEEKREYAAALTTIGATEESIKILQGLDATSSPEVLLLEAYAHIGVWDYAKAIPLLERYLTMPGLSEYLRLVGMTNLAAAFVFERSPRARAVLDNILEVANPSQNAIVYGYALKLLAEEAVWKRSWVEAKQKLEAAFHFFSRTDSIEFLFIRKWQAIVDLYERPTAKQVEKFSPIQKQAQERSHWETLRSIDYHVAVATQDEKLFSHLALGTPYEPLIQKLEKDFGAAVALPSRYAWELNKEEAGRTYEYDLAALCAEKGKLKAGGTLHRLLNTLCEDFYRPLRIAQIHAKLYPNEFFNPDSSPHRVAQLITRLRNHWKRTRSPLEIREKKRTYQLACSKACIVWVTNGRAPQNTDSLRLTRLRLAFGENKFSILESCKELALPNWTVLRLLNDAIAAGELKRLGAARAVRYQFVDRNSKNERQAG